MLKRKACFTEERYTRALEGYLDGVRSVLGGRKVLRAFDAVKQFLVRQENLNDYICREKESASRTLYWLKALASFVSNGALLIVLWSSMFFVVTGRDFVVYSLWKLPNGIINASFPQRFNDLVS